MPVMALTGLVASLGGTGAAVAAVRTVCGVAGGMAAVVMSPTAISQGRGMTRCSRSCRKPFMHSSHETVTSPPPRGAGQTVAESQQISNQTICCFAS